MSRDSRELPSAEYAGRQWRRAWRYFGASTAADTLSPNGTFCLSLGILLLPNLRDAYGNDIGDSRSESISATFWGNMRPRTLTMSNEVPYRTSELSQFLLQ